MFPGVTGSFLHGWLFVGLECDRAQVILAGEALSKFNESEWGKHVDVLLLCKNISSNLKISGFHIILSLDKISEFDFGNIKFLSLPRFTFLLGFSLQIIKVSSNLIISTNIVVTRSFGWFSLLELSRDAWRRETSDRSNVVVVEVEDGCVRISSCTSSFDTSIREEEANVESSSITGRWIFGESYLIVFSLPHQICKYTFLPVDIVSQF